MIASRRFILNFHICLILNVTKTSQKNNVLILQYAKLFNEQKHNEGVQGQHEQAKQYVSLDMDV